MKTRERRSQHHARGQVLPIWILAGITAITLIFLGLNYANTVRWQIRAQNAADSAASTLISIQTQRYNEAEIMLYAADVEEIRLRHLLDGMLLALSGSAGCTGMPSRYATLPMSFTATGGTTCEKVYSDLRIPYLQSVNRYTNDVSLLNSIAYYTTYSNWVSDSSVVLGQISSAANCNQANAHTPNYGGGDCAMKYHLNGTNYRSATTGYPMQPFKFDANTLFLPDQGQALNAWTGPVDSESINFAPPMVDVVTCAAVPPLIPSFGIFSYPTYYAIGRAGATAVPVTGDWTQPGGLIDPVRSTIPFQPYENYTAADAGQSLDYYGMNYNNWTFQTVTYTPPTGPAFQGYSADSAPNYTFNSMWLAWWGVLPIDPRGVDTSPVNVGKDC
jgi:hypothetical protein